MNTRLVLLVDVGNSACKWAWLTAAGLQHHAALAYEDERFSYQYLLEQWQTAGEITDILVAAVANNDVVFQVLHELSSQTHRQIKRLSSSEHAAGVKNAYQHADKLGVDRWLAMIAAKNQLQSAVCVVDCGTAMTIDIIAADGQHLGGQIIPGMQMMANALHNSTALLPQVTSYEDAGCLGKDTDSCISQGIRTALSGAVNSVMSENQHIGPLQGIITGGNGSKIMSMLKGNWQYRPHLVLEGMAVLAKMNNKGDVE
ncbi:MAG: type III pantothenate kinase [Gammaproteobacteria bacterium]|nr:type III pantothenate kinase [Gammaproteobacteria bacterium]